MTELRAKEILRRWDQMKMVRLRHEGRWQECVDYFAPLSSAPMDKRFNELRARRVTSSVPQTALARCGALILSWGIDHTQPFLGANVERGMAMAGRRLSLSAESRDYLDDLQWQVFDRMMLPQSGFLTAAARIGHELPMLGTAIQWIGRKRGFGPRFQARPLRACWIEENQDGEVDTVYFAFRLPAWRVVQTYPEAAKVTKINDLAASDDPAKAATEIELLHVVEPRRGGVRGSVAGRKPFAETILAWEHKAVLSEGGYDDFPFQVPRINPEGDTPYGTGYAWRVLPDARAYNVLQEAIELSIELQVLPPVMAPQGLFGGPMDRRPGAVNYFDTAALGFMSAREAFQKLDLAGDPRIGVEYMNMLAGNIERGMNVDWMRLLANPNMTATQSLEIKDQQLRMISSIVPGIDRDWFGLSADRVLAVLVEEGMIRRPPDEIAGTEVDWDYRGPLASAQRRGQYETVQRMLALQQMAREADETTPSVVSMEEALRSAADALGGPPGLLVSREGVAAAREAARRQQAAQETDRAAMAAMTALRDGAQGVASLAGAGGAEQQAA